MGNSNLYSKQWHCCIIVVSKSCAKATIWLVCVNSSVGHPLDQAICLKSPDPFPPSELLQKQPESRCQNASELLLENLNFWGGGGGGGGGGGETMPPDPPLQVGYGYSSSPLLTIM